VAAGTRRVTALTGVAALEYVREEEELLARAAAALKAPVGQLAERIGAMAEEIKALKKQLTQRKTEAGPKTSAEELLESAEVVGAARVVVARVESVAPDELRQLVDVLRRKAGTGLGVLLVTSSEGKVVLAAGVTPDLVERGLLAGNWLKEVAPVVGGGGGGRPDFAQAGGKSPEKIAEALETAREIAAKRLGGA
jgi:alanyl-tRNA synthetase